MLLLWELWCNTELIASHCFSKLPIRLWQFVQFTARAIFGYRHNVKRKVIVSLFFSKRTSYKAHLGNEHYIFIVYPLRIGFWSSVFKTWFQQNFFDFSIEKNRSLVILSWENCYREKFKVQVKSSSENRKLVSDGYTWLITPLKKIHR